MSQNEKAKSYTTVPVDIRTDPNPLTDVAGSVRRIPVETVNPVKDCLCPGGCCTPTKCYAAGECAAVRKFPNKTTHDLKTFPEYFSAVASGEKTFELRRDDRGFRVGHFVLLREWSPQEEYSGRVICRRISYLLRDFEGLHPDYVCMGLQHG